MNEKNNAFPPKNHSIFIKEGGGMVGGDGGGGMVGGQMVFRDGRGDRSNTTEPYQVNFIVTTKSSDPPPPFLPLAPLKS